jgi:aldehyde:ferredoxin oxidoreductase
MVRFTETCNALADALGICKFAFTETYAVMPADLAEGLRALGMEISDDELFTAGERLVTLERMYNVKHGFSRKDDTLPGRNLQEPLDVYVEPKDINPEKPFEGMNLGETVKNGKKMKPELVHEGLLVDLDPMLNDYYRLGKWNSNGIPTAERLKELDLTFCLQDLPGSIC